MKEVQGGRVTVRVVEKKTAAKAQLRSYAI